MNRRGTPATPALGWVLLLAFLASGLALYAWNRALREIGAPTGPGLDLLAFAEPDACRLFLPDPTFPGDGDGDVSGQCHCGSPDPR